MKIIAGLFILISSIAFATENYDRASFTVEIKNDFCSCINGKSEIKNRCEMFCKYAPISSIPTLYVNTNLISENENSNIHNLYEWCNSQLDGDVTIPQCMIIATDEQRNRTLIPVTISGSIATAAIHQLNFKRNYSLRIVEVKTGSNIGSKKINFKRFKQ